MECQGEKEVGWNRKEGTQNMEEKKRYIRQMLEEMEEREIDMVFYMMRGMEKAKRNRK